MLQVLEVATQNATEKRPAPPVRTTNPEGYSGLSRAEVTGCGRMEAYRSRKPEISLGVCQQMARGGKLCAALTGNDVEVLMRGGVIAAEREGHVY